MMMSVSTRSGSILRKVASPCRPLRASTTWKPYDSRRISRLSRTDASSSMTRTVAQEAPGAAVPAPPRPCRRGSIMGQLPLLAVGDGGIEPRPGRLENSGELRISRSTYGQGRTCLSRDRQAALEKVHHLRAERRVEGGPVDARRIRAELLRLLPQAIGAGRQVDIVAGALDLD